MKTIYAYKVFTIRLGEPNHLYPTFADAWIEPYDKNYIITRGDDCGPFTCLKDLETVKSWFSEMSWHRNTVVYRIEAILSKENCLYINNRKYGCDLKNNGVSSHIKPLVTYIDEFEVIDELSILEVNPICRDYGV